MPLPPAQPGRILIVDIQGLNIERNALVRPESSWQELDNFDLVKPGVIRKIRGNKKLTNQSYSGIIALRDFQQQSDGPELLVVITTAGKLYSSAMNADPIELALEGDLYDESLGVMETAPFVVSLPFPTGEPDGSTIQGIVTTLGNKDFPKKWVNDVIERLGVENPTDEWNVPFQHSAIVPINAGVSTGTIQYLTDNESYGIPIVTGRQIRWTWFNPTTKRDSSLAAFSETDWIIPANDIDLNSPQISRDAGLVKGLYSKNFVMAYPIALDNLPDRTVIVDPVPFPPPSPGYNRIRYWATADGGKDFFLLPKLYNNLGQVITDEDGSVSVNDLSYGLEYTEFHAPDNKVVYDGFIPITDDGPQGPDFADTLIGTVDGPGQTGSTINVSLDFIGLQRSHIRFEGDDTLYAILDITTGSPDTITVDPPVANALTNGAQIRPVYTLPTADVLLVKAFNDSGELPFDRVNDPPPKSVWGAVYQNRLFLLGLDKTSLFYSRIGDHESFPPFNVFRFTQGDYDPITAILSSRQVGLVSEGADQRLLVAKERSTYQISGTSILDFAVTGLFSETGVVHKRAAIVVGGFTLVLSRQGLEVLQGQMPIFVGSRIKDLIDQVQIDEYGPCYAIDRKEGQLLLGMDFVEDAPFPPAPQINKIVTMRIPRPDLDATLSPFATISILPGGPLSVIQECGFGNDPRILCAGTDGNIYQMFTGGTNVLPGGDTEPVVATAISQELPQSDRESRKIFRRVRFDGNEVNDDDGWMISFSTDGSPFTDEVHMYDEVLIGRAGKVLVIKIRHITSVFDPPPQLSNITLDYAVIGEAR